MASLSRHRRGIAEAEDDDVHEGSSGTAADTDTATEEEEDEEEEEEEEDHRLRLGLHSMTAKGIQHLCSELLEIKKASEQDFRANVYVSYLSFLRMFQEAGELEQDVQRLRRQAIAHGRLVQHLGSGLYSSSSMLLAAGSVADDEDMDNVEDDDADDEDEVLNLLLSSEQQLLRAPRRQQQQQQHRSIAERLASVAGNPRTPRAELLRAASGLCRLGEPERANRLVLDWYSARVVRGVEELRLQQQQSNYIKEVARMVFSSIAEAARSLHHHLHGGQQQLLLLWAREEMGDFGAAFSEYVASVPVSSQQLALALEAAECAVVSYAPQLVGISGDVVDVLRGLMAPSIREAVATYARHLKEVVRLLVASDAWVLGRFPVPGAGSCLLTASGRKLVTLVQEVVDDVASPLQRIGMDSAATQLVADLFREYVRCSIVPAACTTPPPPPLRGMNNEHVSILINCATLASLFPAIAASTPAAAACRETAAQVWDCFCQQFVRDTMGMASEQQQQLPQHPMPSLGLQVVFLRVRRLKDAYGAILSGEDGTMKRLLGELMEAIVSWLSANMPDSAQQAHLDVHFLLEIAQLGGVDITATALALLRRPREVDDDDGVSSWAAHAARRAAVQLLSNLHNTSTDDDAEAASSNSAAAVALEDDDDDMASRKSSDEFISIEDDDQDKPTMLNTPLLMGQRQSDNDDGLFHDDDNPPTTTTVTVAAAETGGRNRKKKAAVSTGSSRPRWH